MVTNFFHLSGKHKTPQQTCPEAPKCSTVLHKMAEALGLALDARDDYTHSHSVQVADISSILASALGLNEKQIELIHVAAHLHDIGKIGMPDKVLFKHGPLTGEDWKIMKEHPVIGARIVAPLEDCLGAGIKEMVLYHHERFDGRGYPYGLKGEEIPLGARIIAVADALSAMSQSRPYRIALNFNIASNEIKKNRGTQFCPLVVESFMRQEDIIRKYLERFKQIAGGASVSSGVYRQ
ncbi:HD-GYP domain-containing protein [Desulfovulcanus sp.]